MAIYHQHQVVRLTAAADLSGSEGCFVTVNGSAGTVSPATASSTPAQVFGLLVDVGAAGAPVDVVLPGYAGIVGVRLHSGTSAVVPGDRLSVAANGQVTKAGASGTLVAVALAAGSAGQMIEARLVEPVALAAS